MTDKEIKHEGIIESIDEQGVKVRFLSSTACAGCHAKGVCSVSDSPEKHVVIESPDCQVTPGEKVDIILTRSLGFKALLLGYILPFLAVLFTLIIVITITHREGLAGITALLILVPYYLLLKAFDHRISKEFVFKLGKDK